MNTPECCLETFFAALGGHDLIRARACVLDAKPDSRVDEMLLQFPAVPPTRVDVFRKGDGAEARFQLEGDEPWHVGLRLVGNDWRLRLGRDVDDLIASGVYEQERSFDPLLAWIVHPERYDELMAASRTDAEFKACVSNVRILTHALWNQCVAGSAEVTEQNWREVAQRYLDHLSHPDRHHDWFSCPVSGLPYSLNLADWGERDPDCPIVYEGADGQLSFVHKGRAAVGFCSGVARLVTPEERVRWN